MKKPSGSGGISIFPKGLGLMLQGVIEGERKLAMGRDMGILPADIYEKEDSVMIEVEMPGCAHDQIKLSACGNNLTIEARKLHDAKCAENPSSGINFLCLERKFGKFVRRIELPAPCNTLQAKAALKNGLLTIELPLIRDRRGKVVIIPVETE